MNDRIRNFSTQLSEAAPVPPELEGRAAPTPRSHITAVRVGIALATVAVLGVVGLVVSGDGADRTPVVPAGNQTEVASAGAIADAVSAALPEGFALQLVERVDRYTAHAVAANDRFDVLDIEIIAPGPPEAITDDTAPVESPTSVAVPGTLPADCTVMSVCTGVLPCTPPTTGPYTNTDPCATIPVGDTPTTVAYYVGDTPPDSTIGVAASATGCIVYTPTTDNPEVPVDCTVVVDPNMPPVSVPFPSVPEGVLAGTWNAVPNGTGEITVTTGVDAFGPDEANIPSPFTASSASTDRIFVGIAMYSINAVATEGVAPAILGNLGDIANLEVAIMSLPEALAASDQFTGEAPLEGAFTQRGVVIGSLSVSLSTRIEDGTTLVQVSFPGNLEGSGNDGTIYWHATTIDGRVFIALLNADSTTIRGSDRASFVQKIAEAQATPDAVLVDDGSTTPDPTSTPTVVPPETTVIAP